MGGIPKTLLFIDDEPYDVQRLKHTLSLIEDWNSVLIDCKDWESASESLKRKDLDVILVDYRLPGLNGLEVLKALRQAGDDRPFILLTGFGDEMVATEAMRAGADDYLSKNRMEPAALRRAVQNAVSQYKLRRENALLSQELHHVQRMEAISNLTCGLAHDFNNQLAVVMGFMEIAQAENAPPSPHLEMAKTGCERIAQMVRSLVTFSRQGVADYIDIDLREAMQDLQTILAHTLPDKVALEWDITDEPLMIHGSPAILSQILHGITQNAGEAMRGKGGLIRILIHRQDIGKGQLLQHPGLSEGSYAMVEIADTGPGMDRKTLEQVFDPYFTTKGRDTRRGTGMSLALAWRFVQNLGGIITVDSQPGLGAKFVIALPLRVTFAEFAAKVPGEPLGLTLNPEPGSGTILVVDDEELLLRTSTVLLEHLGYKVYTATDGVKALETFQAFRDEITAVILDLSMPRMDGQECLKCLLALDPEVRVIIATGHNVGQLGPELVKAGAKALLQKPFNFGDLAHALRAVLEAQPAVKSEPAR